MKWDVAVQKILGDDAHRFELDVAFASDACSEASDTQAFRRWSPLIAPVTLSTFPAGQDASCTKATS